MYQQLLKQVGRMSVETGDFTLPKADFHCNNQETKKVARLYRDEVRGIATDCSVLSNDKEEDNPHPPLTHAMASVRLRNTMSRKRENGRFVSVSPSIYIFHTFSIHIHLYFSYFLHSYPFIFFTISLCQYRQYDYMRKDKYCIAVWYKQFFSWHYALIISSDNNGMRFDVVSFTTVDAFGTTKMKYK